MSPRLMSTGGRGRRRRARRAGRRSRSPARAARSAPARAGKRCGLSLVMSSLLPRAPAGSQRTPLYRLFFHWRRPAPWENPGRGKLAATAQVEAVVHESAKPSRWNALAKSRSCTSTGRRKSGWCTDRRRCQRVLPDHEQRLETPPASATGPCAAGTGWPRYRQTRRRAAALIGRVRGQRPGAYATRRSAFWRVVCASHWPVRVAP